MLGVGLALDSGKGLWTDRDETDHSTSKEVKRSVLRDAWTAHGKVQRERQRPGKSSVCFANRMFAFILKLMIIHWKK